MTTVLNLRPLLLQRQAVLRKQHPDWTGLTLAFGVVRDLQMHPYKQQVQHIDFQRVEARTRMTVKVPVHYNGEEESPAVKSENCLVTHVLTEMTVSCFPADIPDFIAVDLTGLTKGKSLHVKDIVLPKRVKAALKGQVNPVMVSVTPIVEEVEVVAEVVDPKAAKGKPGAKPAAKPAAAAAKPAAKK